MMATVTLTLDEYEALRALIGSERESEGAIEASTTAAKPKRKPTAANKRYSAAFKKVKGKYMKKSGGWKKDGFKHASAAAHKLAKK